MGTEFSDSILHEIPKHRYIETLDLCSSVSDNII